MEILQRSAPLLNQDGKEYRLMQSQGTTGGRKWGIWKNMFLVLCDCDAEIKTRKDKNIKIFDYCEVNAKNTGKRSHYFETFIKLSTLLEQKEMEDYEAFKTQYFELATRNPNRI